MSYSQFGYAYPSSHLLSACQSQTSGTIVSTATALVTTTGSATNSNLTSSSSSTPCSGSDMCSCHPQYTSESTRLLTSAYQTRLTSTTAPPPGLPPMYTSGYDPQGYVPLTGTDPSAFYSPLANTYDLTKEGMSASAWGTSAYPYDPTAAMTPYPYTNGYGTMDINGSARRKNATRETTNTLKAWLYEHRKNPYPTKGEKIMLAIITKMTLTQVSTWFANARRRLKKENKMTWSPRNRCGDVDDDDDDGDCDDDKETEDNDDKVICKKEVAIKDSGKIRDEYESETEVGNECASGSLTSGSLSNTPKPMMDNAIMTQQPSNMSRSNYHLPTSHYLPPHHHHHPIHPQYQPPPHHHHPVADNSIYSKTNSEPEAISPSSKPKIWSLAQTATSFGSSLRRSPNIDGEHNTATTTTGLLYANPTYASAFNSNGLKSDKQDSIGGNGIMQCYSVPVPPPPPGSSWLGGSPHAIQPYFAPQTTINSLNNEHVGVGDRKSSCDDIIQTQNGDTPPQTPPTAHQQHNEHQNGVAHHHHHHHQSNDDNLMNNNFINNNGSPYTSSFHGLKSMFDQSTYLGGFKSENDKQTSLPIR